MLVNIKFVEGITVSIKYYCSSFGRYSKMFVIRSLSQYTGRFLLPHRFKELKRIVSEYQDANALLNTTDNETIVS
jgi:hypothetical protein